MSPSKRAACLLLAMLLEQAAPGRAAEAAPRPRIDLLRAEPRGHDVFVGFRLSGALNPELGTRIEAGLETAIRYDVRLYRHNAHWLWDTPIDSRRYRVAVTYDPVTREYVVVETLDGKLLERSTTREFGQVARRLVSRENLLAFRTTDETPRTNLYVQVRATFDSGYLFTIIPVDSRTRWKDSNRFEIKK